LYHRRSATIPFSDPTRIKDRIAEILNAVKAWHGAIVPESRFAEAIDAARIESGMEVLRAIAASPQNGYHGSLATPVSFANGSFLSGYDGEPGIPLIVPFTGANAQPGDPATATEIASYREDSLGVYARGTDGAIIAHDGQDSNGQSSPVSCRYSIVKGYFTFTGKTAQIPLIQLTRAMADTGIPLVYEPTVIKLSIPKLLKEGDNLGEIAGLYARSGADDLQQIAAGSAYVSPLPDIEKAQRQEAA
jgi:hypothetical protein